jgi:hypothetical protein
MNSNLINLNDCLLKIDKANAKAKTFANALAAELDAEPLPNPGPADPDINPSKLPDTGVVVIGGVETINGHSRKADADGFATVPVWSDRSLFNSTIAAHERTTGRGVPATLRDEIWGKSPKRLRCESIRQNCDFPSIEAKLACTQDMGSRRSAVIPGLGENKGTHDAILWLVTLKPTAKERDFNISPESEASKRYDYERLRVLAKANWRDAEPAWCFNFDPSKDVDYANKLYVQFILDELAPKDPIDGVVT